MGGDCRPLLLHIAMVRIRTLVPDALENHWITLIRFGTPRRTPSRYDLACVPRAATTVYPGGEPAISRGAGNPDGLHPRGGGHRARCADGGRRAQPIAAVCSPLAILDRHSLVAGTTALEGRRPCSRRPLDGVLRRSAARATECSWVRRQVPWGRSWLLAA